MGLIPRVAWMGMRIEGRHQELQEVGDLVTTAAATAVRLGEHNLALEWLEQGRSVVWGQTLQLRSPLNLLRESDPIRAERLAAISRALEANTKDTNLSVEARGQQLRSLAHEWDEVLLEVRKLDGFKDFLGPKKVTQLLQAAAFGPIVILNLHRAGCDALVLKPGAQGVTHIPLDLTSKRVHGLLDNFSGLKSQYIPVGHLGSVDRGFRFPAHSADNGHRAMKSLLAELWASVVKPVLDCLEFRTRGIGEDSDLPRIWWCPTGPLAFLPIHAAGLYDTDEPGTKVFDFVVSSYTPTVSALLKAAPFSSSSPKILAVAQTTNTGQSAIPNTKREIELLRQRAIQNSIDILIAQDEAGTVQRVLEEMDKYEWIHLACHGTQDLDHPTKSAFILADGHLQLAEIIKHPLPYAQFAFLSACQTATGDVKLSEEAVHLAAGMLLAGYQSVVATMWAIFDKDGPVISDAVYAEMLKDGKADHTRAAHVLHRAVQSLRQSGAPFMAWMLFIHMGA